ncbi:hypothetical protein BOTBODRAFT_146990 [Botryobasidium botryosum FD-172 SS1]|uniref:Uncharacterized protein n=1 Tax=Botryobasidium botryosum (strain FD-172 SS1) TaxID=930990 RepID=A0A067MB59_BOTB1|nr:hypothetical protein BOTBODRAFT_146990 [Botryobasidium botryosum FD-172 SS1]
MDSTDFALLMPKLEDISTWQRRGDPVFDIDAANVYYSRQIDFHPATHDPIVKHFEPLAILGLWRSSLCLYSPGPGLCRSSFLSAKTSNPTSHFSEIAACAPVCRAPIVETFDECAPLPKLCAKVDRNSGYNPITVGHKLLGNDARLFLSIRNHLNLPRSDYAGYPSLGLHSIGTNAQPAKYQRYEPLTFEDGPDRTCNSFFDPSPSIGQAHRVQPPPSAPTKSQVTFVLAPHLRHSSPSEPKIGSASPPKPSVISSQIVRK